MARRKAAVLDELDYANDHTGEFGSGVRNVSLNRVARPATLSREAEARILGTNTTTRQSAAQMADQNAFDRSFGFTPTHSDAAILNQKKTPTSVPVTPALRTQAAPVNPLDGMTALPVDPFRGITPESRPPVLNTDITRSGPVFPVEPPKPPVPPVPTAPTSAETLGRQVRSSAIRGANVLADVAITKPLAVASQVGNTFSQLANQYVRRPLNYASNVTGDFVRGATTAPPATTPAGVTNATAAQFQVPTKETPLPVTQTTPETKIDRTESSLAKFGLSEDELTKRKRLFAGF